MEEKQPRNDVHERLALQNHLAAREIIDKEYPQPFVASERRRTRTINLATTSLGSRYIDTIQLNDKAIESLGSGHPLSHEVFGGDEPTPITDNVSGSPINSTAEHDETPPPVAPPINPPAQT